MANSVHQFKKNKNSKEQMKIQEWVKKQKFASLVKL